MGDSKRTLLTTTPLGPGLLYRTGDLGSRDAGGRLQYFGRADRQVEVDREADLSVQRAASEAERQPHWSSAHSLSCCYYRQLILPRTP